MISAVGISLNEENNIERYIKSLSFADEIIIVDAFSTDATETIAKKYNVRFIKREFDNFSSQKNFAISKAKNNWIVFFDLDEEITETLSKEIIETVNNNPKEKAFNIKRVNYFMGKRLKYSGFQNDYVVRLFHKAYCKYSNNLVHEVIETNAKIGTLKHYLKHDTYRDFDTYNNKISAYSKLQAEALFKKNKRPNLYHFLFRPWYRFIHQYMFRLGILDGKEGFIVSYLSAFGVFKRYIQLWLMYRNIS